MSEAASSFYDYPWDTTHSFVTSRELHYRMQQDVLKEAGKAIVAIPGVVPKRNKRMNLILAPEVPKYNIQTYQKMFEKVDLARSIVQRTVEFILSVPQDIRPPDSLLQEDTKIQPSAGR